MQENTEISDDKFNEVIASVKTVLALVRKDQGGLKLKEIREKTRIAIERGHFGGPEPYLQLAEIYRVNFEPETTGQPNKFEESTFNKVILKRAFKSVVNSEPKSSHSWTKGSKEVLVELLLDAGELDFQKIKSRIRDQVVGDRITFSNPTIKSHYQSLVALYRRFFDAHPEFATDAQCLKKFLNGPFQNAFNSLKNDARAQIFESLFFSIDHCFQTRNDTKGRIVLPNRHFFRDKSADEVTKREAVARHAAECIIPQADDGDQTKILMNKDSERTSWNHLIPRPREHDDVQEMNLFIGSGVTCYQLAVYIAKNANDYSDLKIHTNNFEAAIILYLLSADAKGHYPFEIFYNGGRINTKHGRTDLKSANPNERSFLDKSLVELRSGAENVKASVTNFLTTIQKSRLKDSTPPGDGFDVELFQKEVTGELEKQIENIRRLLQKSHQVIAPHDLDDVSDVSFHTSVVSMDFADAEGCFYDGDSYNGNYNAVFRKTQNRIVVLTTCSKMNHRNDNNTTLFRWEMDTMDATKEKRKFIVTDSWPVEPEIKKPNEVVVLTM